MNQYNVTIRAVITKTLQVMAEDADKAQEIAHQEFTVECDGDEDYSQDVLDCEEINHKEKAMKATGVNAAGVVEGRFYIERMRVLGSAAHALWDHTDSTDPTVSLMREAAESYAGKFYGVNDCAPVGMGTCALTGVQGELIEVDYEEEIN